jgi:hypothetical protein
VTEPVASADQLARQQAAYLAIEPKLGAALEANRPDSTTEHVSIALPSYSVSETILSHYGDRIPSRRWIVEADGTTRSYSATDNLLDPAWRGLPIVDVIDAVAGAGIGFDYRAGTGVVLHMLSGLAIDGRMGLTAIERTAEGADALQDATRRAIDTLV